MKFRTRIILLLWLCSLTVVLADEDIVPHSNDDFGSGTFTYAIYCPGGAPAAGLFVGQPNPFRRNDRALVKFRITSYLLSGRPVNSAELCFEIGSATKDKEAAYEIEITHLSYDAASFSANDLNNSNGNIVGSVSVNLDDFIEGKKYSIDVTRYVNNDIAKGNVFSSFRFKNITAEKNNVGRTGVTIGKAPPGSESQCDNPPRLKIRNRKDN